MAERAVYTVEEVMELLGISRTKAYQGIHSGEIPSRTIGRRIVIPKVAFDKWLLGEDSGAA